MAQGFDTTQNVTSKLADLKAAGMDFVGRYLSQSHWKVVTPAEAAAIAQAGLGLVLVYEDGSTSAGYFSTDRGLEDGSRALQQAGLVGAPAGTTIYFAVDYDATAADVSGPVTAYFQGVVQSFEATGFAIGVYGSGATCDAITGAGLAARGWLSQSRGWRGYAGYSRWSIRQGPSTVLAGLSVDKDEATGDYGAVPPAG